ncbi:hypothetical protein PAPYR_1600 [Paratrimastix pyriformis]|uniref:Uncharacterized protein n=1 Tax=Paratrimastix pyriformis TaxID=342808 RepID=A0ABQ8UTP6_9EUKA|nr:hypothetical protein PAPYR_1600 [Paratrimastix pyriformis]
MFNSPVNMFIIFSSPKKTTSMESNSDPHCPFRPFRHPEEWQADQAIIEHAGHATQSARDCALGVIPGPSQL